MRTSPLKNRLAAAGASFEERFGVEICSTCSTIETEYRYIREAVGVTDFSSMQKYRIPEDKAIDFLDGLVAGNVAKVRFGRVLHTFIADTDGRLVADCYIANNDQEYILLCESIVDDAALNAMLEQQGASEAGLEDITQSHVAIGIDGYKAWAVAKELFGADVLGLPYLSIELYPFESENIRLIRAGKTSEFGYLLIAPVDCGVKLFDRVSELVMKNNGGIIGLKTHNELRLEGRFFNIFVEGLKVRDPLSLGLQWMIDFDKEAYSGRGSIAARRQDGVAQKIIGVRVDGVREGFVPGAGLFDDSGRVAEIIASSYSFALKAGVGLALFPREIAYSGLQFHLGSSKGPDVSTISMPPIMPKSLTVKLDEL